MKIDDNTPLVTVNRAPRNIVLTNGDRHAEINFEGGVVTFSGDLPCDEAAQAFFKALGFLLFQKEREMAERIASLEAEVATLTTFRATP